MAHVDNSSYEKNSKENFCYIIKMALYLSDNKSLKYQFKVE